MFTDFNSTILQAFAAGHFSPMDDSTRMGFAGATSAALYGEVEGFAIVIDWHEGSMLCEMINEEGETSHINLETGELTSI